MSEVKTLTIRNVPKEVACRFSEMANELGLTQWRLLQQLVNSSNPKEIFNESLSQ